MLCKMIKLPLQYSNNTCKEVSKKINKNKDIQKKKKLEKKPLKVLVSLLYLKQKKEQTLET